MSTFKDRDAARAVPDRAQVSARTPARSPAHMPALVPEHIRARYADQLTRIPSIRLDIRGTASSQRLPAVGSFFG